MVSLVSHAQGAKANEKIDVLPVWMLAGAVFMLECNFNSLKVSGEQGHCSIKALVSHTHHLP